MEQRRDLNVGGAWARRRGTERDWLARGSSRRRRRALAVTLGSSRWLVRTELALAAALALGSVSRSARGDQEPTRAEQPSARRAQDWPRGFRLPARLELIAPLSEPTLDAGAGGGLGLGYAIDLGFVTLMPELGGTAHSVVGDWKPELRRAAAGLEVSFGRSFELGLSTHVGLGELRVDSHAGRRPIQTSPTGDGGIAVSVPLGPHLDVGALASYGLLTGGDAERTFQWATAGGRVCLWF